MGKRTTAWDLVQEWQLDNLEDFEVKEDNEEQYAELAKRLQSQLDSGDHGFHNDAERGVVLPPTAPSRDNKHSDDGNKSSPTSPGDPISPLERRLQHAPDCMAPEIERNVRKWALFGWTQYTIAMTFRIRTLLK